KSAGHYKAVSRRRHVELGATDTLRYNPAPFVTTFREVRPMIHSMTAFARAEQAGANGTLSWELRSVNHRYLEPHLRLPEAFRDLEGAVREALRNGLSRGKVECTLRFSDDSTGKTLQVDLARAAQLVAAAESVAS